MNGGRVYDKAGSHEQEFSAPNNTFTGLLDFMP